MKIIKEYTSPDGYLKLMVAEGSDGTVAIGFEGSNSHTHPDLIHYWLNFPEDRATDLYIEAVLEDKLPIIVSVDGGKSKRPWISDNLPQTIKNNGEVNCRFRLWSGKILSANQALHADSLMLAGER